MKTFWDEEQDRLREEKRIKELKKLFGRENEIPKKIIHKVLQTHKMDPEKLLKLGGYTDIKRGWIKIIEGDERYHAYFDKEKALIYMHRDTIINGYHKAVTKDIHLEFERLRELIPKRKDEFLPHSEYKKAMEQML